MVTCFWDGTLFQGPTDSQRRLHDGKWPVGNRPCRMSLQRRVYCNASRFNRDDPVARESPIRANRNRTGEFSSSFISGVVACGAESDIEIRLDRFPDSEGSPV